MFQNAKDIEMYSMKDNGLYMVINSRKYYDTLIKFTNKYPKENVMPQKIHNKICSAGIFQNKEVKLYAQCNYQETLHFIKR